MDDLRAWATSPLWDDEPTKNRYGYPLKIEAKVAAKEGKRLAVGNPPDETYLRGSFWCATSPQSHIGPYKHAIDFLVPDGTPVIAALGGQVIEIQQHSDRFGDGPEFRGYLNYLTIDHGGGEYSQYCHLAKNSPAQCGLFVGMIVPAGKEIATVGKTGWTDRDHLHFIVFRLAKNDSPFNFKSLVVQFD